MPGYELDLALLAGTLSVLILGPGAYALEEQITSTSAASPAAA